MKVVLDVNCFPLLLIAVISSTFNNDSSESYPSAPSDAQMLSQHQPKWRGRRKVLSIEFAKYTERKEGDYSERRTGEGRCGITFRERRFDLYDLCFGEHRFAICKDVCVSHLHSILHCSRTDIHVQMMLLTSQSPN